MEVKIGTKKYALKNGDYIFFNGAVTLICSGDGRPLRSEKWNRYDYLVATKAVLKQLKPFYKEVEGVKKWILNF